VSLKGQGMPHFSIGDRLKVTRSPELVGTVSKITEDPRNPRWQSVTLRLDDGGVVWGVSAWFSPDGGKGA
jgi:hypothetical protein